ncbi:MAG: hypothetical protein AABY14_00550 [Nanoarchaeota archaeon]
MHLLRGAFFCKEANKMNETDLSVETISKLFYKQIRNLTMRINREKIDKFRCRNCGTLGMMRLE